MPESLLATKPACVGPGERISTFRSVPGREDARPPASGVDVDDFLAQRERNRSAFGREKRVRHRGRAEWFFAGVGHRQRAPRIGDGAGTVVVARHYVAGFVVFDEDFRSDPHGSAVGFNVQRFRFDVVAVTGEDAAEV